MKRVPRVSLLAAFLLASVASGASTVVWMSQDPVALLLGGGQTLKVRVKINGSPTVVQIALTDGTVVPFKADGGGLWSATLTSGQALGRYSAASVNQVHIGFLKVREGAVESDTLNVSVNVVDERVPSVPVVPLGPGAQRSLRIVNVHRPDLESVSPTGDQLTSVLRQLYQLEGDDYEFVQVVFALPEFAENRLAHAQREARSLAGAGWAPQ